MSLAVGGACYVGVTSIETALRLLRCRRKVLLGNAPIARDGWDLFEQLQFLEGRLSLGLQNSFLKSRDKPAPTVLSFYQLLTKSFVETSGQTVNLYMQLLRLS